VSTLRRLDRPASPVRRRFLDRLANRLALALCAAALPRPVTATGATGVTGATGPDVTDLTGPAGTGAPVAVASSLRFAWPALHAAAGSPPLRATFGASRTLARQMLQGAPFELLLSADAESIALLVDGGRADADGTAGAVEYARGRLVWASRADDAPEDIASLAAWWRASPERRLAIAHPDHAPYGRAAIQVLQALSVGPIGPQQLLRGENAGQALQFFAAGAADAALLPVSLVRHATASTMRSGQPPWRELPIDPSLHEPLAHRAIAVHGAGAAARRLLDALPGEPVQQALRAAGFDPAGAG